MAYEIAKFLHLTGVVMLMGNITVTAIWKYFADRTGQPEVLSFAQKLVTYTDWSMTLWGAVLIMGGGYFRAVAAHVILVVCEPTIVSRSRPDLASSACPNTSSTSTVG